MMATPMPGASGAEAKITSTPSSIDCAKRVEQVACDGGVIDPRSAAVRRDPSCRSNRRKAWCQRTQVLFRRNHADTQAGGHRRANLRGDPLGDRGRVTNVGGESR